MQSFLESIAPQTFKVTNWTNMVAFGAMIFAPNHKITKKITLFTPLLHAFNYSVLVGNTLAQGSLKMSDFATLAGVRALFSNNIAVLLGWIHYAAFDLLVGRWILNDSKKENIKHWFVAPCLFLTMMFGPLGFLSYVGLKTYHTRSLKWD
jgi:hypothetical protein